MQTIITKLFQSYFRAICMFALLLLGLSRSSARVDLSGPVWTNGQFQFTLNYWGGAHVVVESSPDLVNWTPILSNTILDAHVTITPPAPDSIAFYRVVGYPIPPTPPLFSYALAAQGNLIANGLGLLVDSFNSLDTNLSTNGLYDPTRTSTNGNVACVSGIVDIGGHTIVGSLYLGQGATYASSTNQVTGQIYTNYSVQFPDVVLPTTDTNGNPIVWLPAPTISSGGKTPTITNIFTSNGYYYVNNPNPIYVAPGVSVILQITTNTFNPSSVSISGGTTNSGTLIIYQVSGSATLGGNATGGAIGNRPANFIYFGLSGVTSVTLLGTVAFVGIIYAPEASITINSGGSLNNFSGSCIANDINVNGHYAFHFDESLLTSGPVH